jgi:hypothetical protein
MGAFAQARQDYSFVWSDETPFSSTAVGQFMVHATDGNVGIGTTTPDTELTVNGFADKPGGGSWSTYSDARLKDVGGNFTPGLAALEKIKPVHYHYKTDNALKLPSQPEYIGLVAQQLQQAVPDAVQTNSSGYLTVNNDPVIWTTVNAVKELNEVVQAKDAKIQELENRLANLEKTVQALNGKE